VRALDVAYIGKESNELEAVDAGLVHDSNEVITIYADEQDESWKRDVLSALKRIPCKQLAEAAGVSERTIQRIRNGHQTASSSIRRRLSGLCGRAPTDL